MVLYGICERFPNVRGISNRKDSWSETRGDVKMKSVIAFLKDENGQTSTEYILLVAVVALIVVKFKAVAVDRLTQLTGKVFDAGNNIADEITTQ